MINVEMFTDDGRRMMDNGRRTTHNDGRQPIAIGHLSDSCDLKTHNSLYELWIILHLNNLESPSPKASLWQVWFKLVQWFLRRRFFKFCQCTFAISLISPLGKGQGPSFEQTPFTQGCIVPSLVEIDTWEDFFKVRQCIFAIL